MQADLAVGLAVHQPDGQATTQLATGGLVADPAIEPNTQDVKLSFLCGLDCYADLRAYGDDVEGVTEFFPEKGPKVSISEHISGDDRRENRYRTTLTHEFGHVKFHGPLWAEKFATGDLLDRRPHANKAVSKRDNILNAPQSDWMEWQAGYISGALLMPVTPVRRLVSDYCSPRELHGNIHVTSDHAVVLTQMVMERFAVSEEAARVRLLKLNLITTTTGQASLFG
jgi:hypothetical protein